MNGREFLLDVVHKLLKLTVEQHDQGVREELTGIVPETGGKQVVGLVEQLAQVVDAVMFGVDQRNYKIKKFLFHDEAVFVQVEHEDFLYVLEQNVLDAELFFFGVGLLHAAGVVEQFPRDGFDEFADLGLLGVVVGFG